LLFARFAVNAIIIERTEAISYERVPNIAERIREVRTFQFNVVCS
jgi:hypothetical protein